MSKRIISIVLALTMCLGMIAVFASCSPSGAKTDALVIMSEELDGLFNPFFSTTAADGTIVSMTQIGMLTTGYENGVAGIACGDDEAVVVKDYDIVTTGSGDDQKTVYTFVIKNGIKFSDGQPLTIEDVLFNMYVYLDPVYAGSNTMYSTDIVGLQAYRYQQEVSGDSNAEDLITNQASQRAANRIQELISVYKQVGDPKGTGNYNADEAKMKAAINSWALSSGYKAAISTDASKVTNAQLLADYENTLKLFKEELEADYVAAQDAFLEKPYSEEPEFTGDMKEIYSFMMYEGYVNLEYEKDENNKDIKSDIKKVEANFPTTIKTKDAAIEYVYNDMITSSLNVVLLYTASTAQKLNNDYVAKAKEVILHESSVGGEMKIKNISGIVSLGHTTDTATVTTQKGTYTVAHEHNEDGTPKNAEEYDVLQITINGVDPKAIWNFAFSVAPQHYYAKGREVDIKNNKFGVDFGSYDFMTGVIQNPEVTKVPMGAGPYKATNSENADNPTGNDFYKDNVVYFKANESFLMGAPKIEKLRYQVVSASNALSNLESGTVHFVTPQFTPDNIKKLNEMSKDGINRLDTWQLGYGYIGINAGKVPDINIRKAIMTAMDTSLALSYYDTGTAETIYWPMSTVSWAYPQEGGGNSRNNGHSYPAIKFNREWAKSEIQKYMEAAGVSAGHSSLKIKFTIAGSNLTEHPTYQTFQGAADLLNECGWEIEVVPDTQALTKLSTGSLAVWAAAWGSTIDPDLYQVYHKNSSATSTLAWGYREILNNPSQYVEENEILTKLSEKIDEARETNDQATRTALYKEAMSYILDLAVELPVYQRKVLYAYNSNVIDPDSLPAEINPYTSPLDRIWEIEFAK